MKGLEISERFFNEFGKPMLEAEFPYLFPLLAVGFCGSGSECFGYDDDISKDHDFEPGFCIFLPNESVIDRKEAFKLERAYAKLPKEFMGLKRGLTSPVGGNRHGVIRISDFFEEKTGFANGDLDLCSWLTISSQSLAEASNGKIFFDNYGEITRIRQKLSFFPNDIMLKRLAGNLLIMAQSGQYNYVRCLKHNETDAAQLAVFEFVKSAMAVIFLLNGSYQPFYKWSFKALKNLQLLGEEAPKFSSLITTPCDEAHAEDKYYTIEGIVADVIDILVEKGLTKAMCGDLEKHAYSVNDMITDSSVRNLHILSAI